MPQHTDHAGVMWHGTYLSFLEESRISALSEVGLSYREISEEGYEMPVISLKINYKIAINHGENILLESFLKSINGPRLSWGSIFFNDKGLRAAEAEVDLAVIRKTEKGHIIVRKFPSYIAHALKELGSD
tara:strand:- start:46 stop:435 length:390 start_codon:yes stop_codon:yes gene_type:complete